MTLLSASETRLTRTEDHKSATYTVECKSLSGYSMPVWTSATAERRERGVCFICSAVHEIKGVSVLVHVWVSAGSWLESLPVVKFKRIQTLAQRYVTVGIDSACWLQRDQNRIMSIPWWQKLIKLLRHNNRSLGWLSSTSTVSQSAQKQAPAKHEQLLTEDPASSDYSSFPPNIFSGKLFKETTRLKNSYIKPE